MFSVVSFKYTNSCFCMAREDMGKDDKAFFFKKDQLSRITSFFLGNIKIVFTFKKPLVSSACLHCSLITPPATSLHLPV